MTRHSQPRPKNTAPPTPRKAKTPFAGDEEPRTPELRIIGGHHRGRKLLYNGDLRTRPMKDRVRESVFNLIGTEAVGKHAIDLFAGTGALGLEAISRGATRATFVEQHFPTAAVIRQNAETLRETAKCTVNGGNTFIWAKRLPGLGGTPWLVFCSPPYAFYVDRQAEMLELIGTFAERAPAESILVVEADEHFDYALLPHAAEYDVRVYPPAVIGIWRKA